MTIKVVSSDGSVADEVAAPEVEKSAEEQKEVLSKEESLESETSEKEEIEAKDESESDESTDHESDDEESKDEANGEKPKKKSGFKRRVDKLNLRIAEKERELEYWKSQALKGAGTEKKEEVAAKSDKSASDKPKPEDFETHAEFVDALTDWKIEQRDKAKEEQSQKAKLKTEHEKIVESHQARVKAFAEKTDDFEDVLESVDDVVPSPAVENLIVSSENGPELMYELAKNREEFLRINKLPPLQAAVAIGRLEAKLQKSSEEKPIKKITKAPKPITPVGTKGSVVEKSIYDPNISQKEYERLRAKEEAAKYAS